MELAKSYIQDGVKILISYSLISLLKELKSLFAKNKILRPCLDELTIDYQDCKIIIYRLFESSIEESIQAILQHLCQFQLKHKRIFKNIEVIHVPIINSKDSYNLCDFRVKLSVDELIREFTKDYYFMFWGLTTNNGKYLYNLSKGKILKRRFYTQTEYDELFHRAFKKRRINFS